MPRLSCAACFHSFRRETESPRSLQGSTPQPEAASSVAVRRMEDPTSDNNASIATQPSTKPEQTAESFTEAEIKDLCSTIVKTATQLTHANPVERSQLMDAMAVSTARLQSLSAGSDAPNAATTTGVLPPVEGTVLAEPRILRSNALEETQPMERQDTASDERAGECTPKLLWLSLAANDAKSIDAMDRKWIGCEVRHKSRGKGALLLRVLPCTRVAPPPAS